MPVLVSSILNNNGLGFTGSVGYTGSVGSGYTGSAGSALTNWSVKTANYTALPGDRIVANTAVGTFYITLPPTPVTGDYVKISDGYNFAQNPLQIIANGSTISNQNIDLSIDVRSVDLEFLYTGTTWQVISTFGPKGFTGSVGNFTNWTVVTANYTAVNNERIIADTSSGTFYLTLPANPGTGNCIQITDGYNFNVNPLIILPNGRTIEGVADSVVVDIGGVDIELFYSNSMWNLISTYGPIGYTGSRGVIGFTGSQGVIGYTGSQGDIGYSGSRGDLGYTGSVGDVSLSGTQTLSNKTLISPNISYILNTGNLTLPTVTDTLVARTTTDTLSNKTLLSPNISYILNTGNLTLPISTDTLVARNTTDTLLNKTITSMGVNSSILGSDTVSYTVGYKYVPQNPQSTAYTLVNSDESKHIYYTGGSATLTIPVDGSTTGGNFAVGATITIINHGSGTLTVSHAGSLFLAGNTTASTRAIQPKGVVAIMKVATNTWYMNGGGVV